MLDLSSLPFCMESQFPHNREGGIIDRELNGSHVEPDADIPSPDTLQENIRQQAYSIHEIIELTAFDRLIEGNIEASRYVDRFENLGISVAPVRERFKKRCTELKLFRALLELLRIHIMALESRVSGDNVIVFHASSTYRNEAKDYSSLLLQLPDFDPKETLKELSELRDDLERDVQVGRTSYPIF